jgi:hypothetical protein
MRRIRRESVLIALAAIAVIAIELSATHSWALITRPLWLDELHTLLIASRGTFADSMRALASGADTNPPTVFVVYRLLGRAIGELSPISMRAVALATVVGAIVLCYSVLRAELAVMPAICGAVALWAQTVVMESAFNARFYGPWLFSAAALVVVLRRALVGPWNWRQSVMLGATSGIVCTVHYFGVLSWGSAVIVTLVLGRHTLPNVVRRLVPAVAGPIAIAACAPFYFGQRAAISITTWIPRASVADLGVLLVVALLSLSLIAALVGWAASAFFRSRSRTAGTDAERTSLIGPGQWLLLSQVGVPLALIVFSLVVQPATQLRYWVPSSLSVACAVAIAVSRSVRSLQWLTLAFSLASSVAIVADQGGAANEFARSVREDSTYVARAVKERGTIVVRRRHSLYPVLQALPSAVPNAFLFGGPSGGRDSLLVLNDLDIARVHQRRYGFPRITSRVQLDSLSQFYFLELDPARAPTPAEFPGRTIERVAPRLFLIRQAPAHRTA